MSKKANMDQRGAGETDLFKTDPSREDGALAPNLIPTKPGGIIDIVKEYPWCLNNIQNRNDIPYVMLKEYKMNESAIKNQLLFYYSGLKDTASAKQTGMLDVYDELFPRDTENLTNFRYKFPYFGEVNMELTTSPWKTVDGAEMLKGALPEGASKMMETVQNLGTIGLSFKYPTVGIYDRPRIFERHESRSLEIQFPLYNTISNVADSNSISVWEKNRNFLFLFMNQNLFNKRDFVTGVSPCYYEVEIPGQFYSPAACVTSFRVNNLGHIRTMVSETKKRPLVVPDAYQVNITLTDMIMPSQNIWQAIDSGEAHSRVTVNAGAITSRTADTNALANTFDNTAGQVVDMARGAADGIGSGIRKVASSLTPGKPGQK